jgi:hypothetical protein
MKDISLRDLLKTLYSIEGSPFNAKNWLQNEGGGNIDGSEDGFKSLNEKKSIKKCKPLVPPPIPALTLSDLFVQTMHAELEYFTIRKKAEQFEYEEWKRLKKPERIEIKIGDKKRSDENTSEYCCNLSKSPSSSFRNTFASLSFIELYDILLNFILHRLGCECCSSCIGPVECKMYGGLNGVCSSYCDPKKKKRASEEKKIKKKNGSLEETNVENASVNQKKKDLQENQICKNGTLGNFPFKVPPSFLEVKQKELTPYVSSMVSPELPISLKGGSEEGLLPSPPLPFDRSLRQNELMRRRRKKGPDSFTACLFKSLVMSLSPSVLRQLFQYMEV